MSLYDDLPEPAPNPDEPGVKRKAEDDPWASHTKLLKSSAGESEQGSLNCKLSPCFPVQVAVCARKGERPEMQDAHVVAEDFMKGLPIEKSLSRLSFCAVYDGHGGIRASQFLSKKLHPLLAENLPKADGAAAFERDFKKIIKDVYKRIDDQFLHMASVQRPHWRDGSTATTLLIANNTVYCAGVGDSHCVLYRQNQDSDSLTAIPLTTEHNPQDFGERQRIQKAGGVVRDGRVSGMLEVSRSFGDYQFKKQGVICIPDLKKCQLTEKDRFLVLACDGLWKSYPQDKLGSVIAAKLAAEESLDTVVTQLANEAVRKLSGDNVTIILLVFKSA